MEASNGGTESGYSPTLQALSPSFSATPTDLLKSFASATAFLAATDDGTDAIEATTTSTVPVQITNAISLVACLCVVVSYFFFRRKNQRIMERPSLILAVSMAAADGLLHCINEFGYTDLPHNFICSFFGGFLYAFPTLISIFYSFCIALNTMLVFVFSKRPGNSTLKYYIGIPIVLSALICIPALGAGVYGYDATYDLCWIASDGTMASSQVLTRYLLTFALWCLVVMAFLIVAAVLIINSVFSRTSKLNQLSSGISKALSSPIATGAARRPPGRQSTFYANGEVTNNNYSRPTSGYVTGQESRLGVGSLKSEFETEPSTPTVAPPRNRITHAISTVYHSGVGSAHNAHANAKPPVRQEDTILSRRSQAMKALALRLLGYILIPTVCILPGVIIDLITKMSPTAAASIPDSLSTFFDTLNGLVGLLNAILYAMDPALLALYHQIRMARREKAQLKDGGAGGRHGGNIEMDAARTGMSVYTTPPESPGPGTPSFGFDGDKSGQEEPPEFALSSNPDVYAHARATGNPNQVDLENGTKVEVRSGKFLSPIRIGGRVKKSERGLPSPRTPNANGSGIMISVEVEVNDDRDHELERLERYLGGL